MVLLDRLRRGDEGVAVLEMALVLPVLFLLMGGFLEYGRMLLDHQRIEAAARDAARFLARARTVEPGCTDVASGGTAAQAASHTARLLAVYGRPDATATPVIPYWPGEGLDTICIARTTDATGAAVVSVTITLPYEGLGLLGLVSSSQPTLSAVHRQPYIGSNG